MSQKIQMVDLVTQYTRLKDEIDAAVLNCMASAKYINGPEVGEFESQLASYLGVRNVIGCANGTDALQIALMALGLSPGDEVIVPAFTYVATAEVIALLGLVPKMVDVDASTFNIDVAAFKSAITSQTKAVVPVHLFGQSCDMKPILDISLAEGIRVIEDNAQAIGATYSFPDGAAARTGTMGDMGCLSFFPSKNLGCFGDGGAITTNNDELAAAARMIANHGQKRKYYHSVIGVNSRLDTLQAAILKVKLDHLDEFCSARQEVAEGYDAAFAGMKGIEGPARANNSTHVFHQYTLKVPVERRGALQSHLAENGIPSMIYYPLPLYKQDAFSHFNPEDFSLPVTETLCESVISLPIHTEMESGDQKRVIDSVTSFFNEAAASVTK
jgi:UDP-2-acetamido-2-deoxy-ribo-hexuluronate aminotransferase